MTYWSNQNVTLNDGAQLNAFGSLRTSQPFTQFDVSRIGSNRTDLLDTLLEGSGTTTFNIDESSETMSVTGATDRVVIQSRRYSYYQPGKSILIEITGVLTDSLASNIESKIGLFDDHNDKVVDSRGNGFFFQFSNGSLSVNKRSYSSGSQVDTSIPQASWNIDSLDGNGTSGLTLNPDKTNIFVIDAQWLGVGRVRMGVVIDGIILYVHEFLHAGIESSAYITSMDLPVRWEISSLGGAGSTKSICASVQSEGGFEPLGIIGSTNTGIPSISLPNGSEGPLLAIRCKDAFNRMSLNPLSFSVVADSGSVGLIEIYNATSVTGGSWTSASDAVEQNSTFTSYIGIKILSFYMSDRSKSGSATSLNKLFTGSDIAGNQESLVVVGSGVDGPINDAWCAIDYQEVR